MKKISSVFLMFSIIYTIAVSSVYAYSYKDLENARNDMFCRASSTIKDVKLANIKYCQRVNSELLKRLKEGFNPNQPKPLNIPFFDNRIITADNFKCEVLEAVNIYSYLYYLELNNI